MTKIKIEGRAAREIQALITKALRDVGLKVTSFYDVTPSEIANCRREATRESADVSIVAMTK